MKPFAVAGLPPDELNSFLSGTHSDPFRILGPHRMGDDLAIRAFRPDARKIDIVRNGEAPVEAEKIHRDGFFQAKIPNATRDLDYHLRVTHWDGSHYAMRDPHTYAQQKGTGRNTGCAKRINTGRSWVRSIFTCSAKASTGSSMKSSARICE